MIYISIFIFTGTFFVVSRFIKSSYISFMICCILCGFGLILSSLIPNSSKLFIYSTLTPFTLIFGLHGRFMYNSVTAFKYYELINIGSWILVLSYLTYYSIKSFKKSSIT